MTVAASQSQRRTLRPSVARREPQAIVVKRRVQFSLLVLLALLVAVLTTGVFAAYNLYRSAEDHYIRLALPLQRTTRDVLYQMEREETGMRGYMITQNRDSLKPLLAGRRGVTEDLADLQRLTAGHPELVARLQEVRQRVTSLHGFYNRLVVFVADGQVGQKRAKREVLNGEVLANQFRTSAAGLQDDARALVQSTRKAQRATFLRTIVTLSIAGALALAVGATLLAKLPERLRRLYDSEEQARLRAEQGANASRALEHVSDAVLLVDEEGIIHFWNDAAELVFGVPSRDAVGRQVATVIPDYDRLVEAVERDDRFVPVVVNDDERWLTPSISVFNGGSVLTVRDATAGYVLERARSDFVATASHELRTPLTAVYGGARTLLAHRDELPRGQQERLLTMIEQESQHLVEIVDQLLVSAQLDRGGLSLHESSADVVALATGVVESARIRASGKNTVMLQTPTSMAPVQVDESLLRQVLVNLVENAIKYSPDGGRVDVVVSEEPGWVRVDVADEGIGIPASEQDRIFEKFYRLDAAMNRGVGGSGLGLYISREIVMQMGGTLSVRSVPDAGSTFTVLLPRADIAPLEA